MKKVACALGFAALLSGCGGGGSSAPITWYSPVPGKTYTWSGAGAVCAGINSRLPTVVELSAYARSGKEINGGGVWSSDPAPIATYRYWVTLNGTSGTADVMPESSFLYVRCVQ
jgi:hypothetical protein